MTATFGRLDIEGGPSGVVEARVVRPAGARGPLPVVLLPRGPGGRLARELAVRAGAAVVVVEHSRRAPYPVAVEECYAALVWVAAHGAGHGLDPSRLAVAGDATGGNLAAALTILAKQRSGPTLVAQVLYCPVTDAACDTASHHRYAEGYGLRRDAVRSFWDHYAPDPAARAEITAAPLRASLDDLAGLPPALVIVAEADVLRDEGEAYAARLRAAGVPVTAVRYQGAVHGFATADPPRDPAAAEAALTQGAHFLTEALH